MPLRHQTAYDNERKQEVDKLSSSEDSDWTKSSPPVRSREYSSSSTEESGDTENSSGRTDAGVCCSDTKLM